MISSKLLFIFCTLTSFTYAEHLFSQLTDAYIITETPTYLSAPVVYTEDLKICGLVGNSSSRAESYCNSTTLLQIQQIVSSFAGNATDKINSTITFIRDSFEKIGELLWRRFEADRVTLDGLKSAIEKIIVDYKRFQLGLARELSNCVNTVSRIMGGFLCAGCNATRNPGYIRPSVQPIIHVKSNVVAAIEQNCTSLMQKISESVDIYHRTKMILVDLLAAHLGSESHICTCSGQPTNYTNIMVYNVSGTYRNLGTNDYVITPENWNPYVNETQMEDSEVSAAAQLYAPKTTIPYFIVNSSEIYNDKEVEEYSNKTLNTTGISIIQDIKYKNYKTEYLSDFTALAFAVGRVLNRTIQKRTFTSLYQELNELINLSGFSYDEIRDISLNLYSSFMLVTSDPSRMTLIYKLFVKLAIDFLLKPPPSAYYIGFSMPNATAYIIAKYGAELLKLVKGYRYLEHELGYVCELPYLNLYGTNIDSIVSKFSCSVIGTCNLENLAKCEARIIQDKPNVAIVFPLFRMMNRVKTNITDYKSVVQDFVTMFKDISLVDQDFKNYMMIKYFPPHYYIINAQERKLSSKNAMATAAEETYENKIKRYLQEIYEDFTVYVKSSSRNIELLREILRAEKDVARSDNLLRKYAYELDSTEYQKLMTYEQNKRAAIYLMKCMSETACKVGYIGKEGKTVEVSLPVKTSMNPNFALMEKRMLNGLLGMMSLTEISPYDDEENLALAKCGRLFSARTLLCIESVEQDLLEFPTLEKPADYSKLRGTELASVFFTRYKVQSLLEFASPLQTAAVDIGQGKGGIIPNDPIIVADDVNGLDLLAETGLNYTLNNTRLVFNMEFAKVVPPTISDQSSFSTKLSLSFISVILIIAMILF